MRIDRLPVAIQLDMNRSRRFAPAAIWRALTFVTLLNQAVAAQTSALYFGDRARIPKGSFRIVDEMALENWVLDVYARRDGWVEVDLAVIPSRRLALPWLYSDRVAGKIGAPVSSRAYFTPAQIRASTRFADSLLDRVIPDSVAAKRFSWGAPTFINMPIGLKRGNSGSLFHMYMFPLRSRPGVPDSVEAGIGGCLGVGDTGPALMGRRLPRSAQEFRAIMRSLDDAASLSGMYASTPKELHADLVNADEAACEARPERGLVRPEYPAEGAGRSAGVHIDAVVDTVGRIDESTIRVVISGGAVFDTVAVNTVRQWRFTPAVVTTAVPVAQRLHIDVRFAPKAPTDVEMDRIIEDASAHGAGIVVISKARKE